MIEEQIPIGFHPMYGVDNSYLNRSRTLAVAFPFKDDHNYIEFFRYKAGWFVVSRHEYEQIVFMLSML